LRLCSWLRAIDGLADVSGGQGRALPALRALLDLPFERVVISHGA
jgi:hypothetical protein